MSYDLKDESQVKEFIENLGIEYRFGCYHEKKPEVCHLLGDYLESIKKDFEKSAKVYQSNCDDMKFGKSCYKFGNYTYMGKGKGAEKGDHEEALKYFEKGCVLNDPDSCLHAGLMLVSSAMFKDIKPDVLRGFEMLQRSCDSKKAGACYYLSGMYISGIKKSQESAENVKMDNSKQAKESKKDYYVLKDMKKAFELAKKACDLDHMYACANLSQMYRRGDGTEKNLELADQYKKKALDMQDQIKNIQRQVEFGT